MRAAAGEVDVIARLIASLPTDFSRWSSLAQDQYLEVRTLLMGYLLSSQGDRMLMAHSVEGRFPYLDMDVVALANALPPSFKLRVLDEKHVLKRAAAGLVPDAIIHRSKQPYRAPDARSFVDPAGMSAWVGEILSEPAIRDAGVFDPTAVTRLWTKVRAQPADRPFSNADNLALVGILSTGLLHELLVRPAPERGAAISFQTVIDRVGETCSDTRPTASSPESLAQ
jgi:asparagine synthase (glutamine-hydrolysing)